MNSIAIFTIRAVVASIAIVASFDRCETTRAQSAGPSLGAPDFRPSPQHSVGWRGDGSGQYSSARPPTKWSAKENVLWKTEVGAGHSSPIVVGTRVFVTAEPDLLVCLDAGSGKELWRKAHRLSDLPAELHAHAPPQAEHYGDTTPTPVSDGKSVWVFFNTGIVACQDLEGKCRWMNWYDMRLAPSYGRTASPVLVGERLLIHFGPLVCLDAAAGKVLWSAKGTYGTPVPARIGDTDVVVTPKGQIVRVADGKTLASGLGPCAYASPIVLDGVVYFLGRDLSAVRLPAKVGGQLEGRELWYEDLGGEFFASPLVYDGRVYAIDRAANYYVIDAVTGKTLLKKALELAPAGCANGPNVYPSICLAGKQIFLSNDAGESMLLEPGDKPAVAATNSLPRGSGASAAFVGRRIYIRGGTLLYCIGK